MRCFRHFVEQITARDGFALRGKWRHLEMFLVSQLVLLLASSGQRPEMPSNTLQDTGRRHDEDCLAPNGIELKVTNLAAEGNKPPVTLVT